MVESTHQPIYIIDNSQGELDEQLDWAEYDLKITVIRNRKNLGKPTSIRNNWSRIPNSQWFITMDPDVIIPENGIDTLISDANALSEAGYRIGVMAPALFQENRTWEKQIDKQNLVMHNWVEMSTIYPKIYHNSALAGCLMLVNTTFYNHIGGFKGIKKYNDDDGWLCNESIKCELLNVLNSRVICEHDVSEETPEYRLWKKRNFIQQVDLLGHWDQQCHHKTHL